MKETYLSSFSWGPFVFVFLHSILGWLLGFRASFKLKWVDLLFICGGFYGCLLILITWSTVGPSCVFDVGFCVRVLKDETESVATIMKF